MSRFYDKLFPNFEFMSLHNKENFFSNFRSKGEVRVLKYRYQKTIDANNVIGSLEN